MFYREHQLDHDQSYDSSCKVAQKCRKCKLEWKTEKKLKVCPASNCNGKEFDTIEANDG